MKNVLIKAALALALAELLSCNVGHAQSMFGSLISQLPDSIHSFKGPRIMGPAAVTAYSPYAKTFSAMTGLGIGYTWQTLKNDSSAWYINAAVGGMLYGGGSQVPNNIAGVIAAGPYFSVFNGYLSGGIAYDFSNLQPPIVPGQTAIPAPPKFGQRLLYVIGAVIPLF